MPTVSNLVPIILNMFTCLLSPHVCNQFPDHTDHLLKALVPLARVPLPFPHLPMLGNINFWSLPTENFLPTPHQGYREGLFIMGLRAGWGNVGSNEENLWSGYSWNDYLELSHLRGRKEQVWEIKVGTYLDLSTCFYVVLLIIGNFKALKKTVLFLIIGFQFPCLLLFAVVI